MAQHPHHDEKLKWHTGHYELQSTTKVDKVSSNGSRGDSNTSANPATVRSEDWLSAARNDNFAWRPLCARTSFCSDVSAYGVCVTRREVELLTGTKLHKRSSGPRYLKVRPEYNADGEGVFIMGQRTHPLTRDFHTLLPEWTRLKDPLEEDPVPSRVYTVILCFFLTPMETQDTSMHFAHQAQRRIIEFVKSLLGKPHPAMRAKALLECKRDCEAIIRQYCPKKAGNTIPYKRTIDEWRRLRALNWNSWARLVADVHPGRRGEGEQSGNGEAIRCVCATCHPEGNARVDLEEEEAWKKTGEDTWFEMKRMLQAKQSGAGAR